MEMLNNPMFREDIIWKDAIKALDRELVLIGSSIECFDSPQDALNFIIDWHVDVATDPRTNGGYELIKIEKAY